MKHHGLHDRENRDPRRSQIRVWSAQIATSALVISSLTTGLAASATADAHNPDFGPNVTIFDPTMSPQDINAELRSAAADMSGDANHWTTKRRAFFFKPGSYGDSSYAGAEDDPTKIINAEVGYYTSVAGLGLSPADVKIAGAFQVNAEQVCANNPWDCPGPGSLNNFWRSLANMQITPIQRPYGQDATRPFPEGTVEANRMRWAVSQAAPMRRVHIKGDLTYMGRMGAYASGGFTADTKIDGQIQTGSQQQYFHRNSSIGQPYTEQGVWNMVFAGTDGAPADDYPDSRLGVVGHTPDPNTPDPNDPEFASMHNKHANYGNTPISREAPYLTWDETDGYGVFVPDARTDSSGVSWTETSPGAGTRISLDQFVIAKPGTNGTVDVAALNFAISEGKHIIFTPGEYLLTQPLHVDRADTVVLGLGLATLRPVNGTAAITVGDVAGVKLAGLMIEAHSTKSEVLVQVGPRGATAGDATNPTTLSDVFFRIGGAQRGNVDTALEVNSHYALLDNIWSWRADHGADTRNDSDRPDAPLGYLWQDNPGDVGARINGDHVTALGLFVEHYQKNQTEWNGEDGLTIFYQNELPYEPAQQSDWTDRGRDGYAAYKVDPSVTTHELFGAGVYSYFRWVDTVWQESAISVPKRSTVSVNRAVTRWLNGCVPADSTERGIDGCSDGKGGGIRHIVNDQGKASTGLSSQANDEYWARFPQADCNEPTQGRFYCAITQGHMTTWMRSYDSTLGDVTAPTLTVTTQVGTSDVTFTAVASDDATSTAPVVIDYKIDDELWAPGATSFTVPKSANTVQVRAVDPAGNVSQVYSWTNPDPSEGGGNNGGENNGGGDDNGSGNNGGGDSSGSENGTNPPGTITKGATLTAAITLSPTKASGKRGWYRKPVTVRATGTAPDGTTALVQIRVNNGPWRTYTGPTAVKKNGKKVRISARTIVVGTAQSSSIAERTVKIDTKKPGKKKLKAVFKVRRGTPVLRLKAKDKTAKVHKIVYRLGGSTKWKKYKKAKGVKITASLNRIKFRAIDKAGNKSKVKKVRIKAAWRR